jgi:hypothetical protein
LSYRCLQSLGSNLQGVFPVGFQVYKAPIKVYRFHLPSYSFFHLWNSSFSEHIPCTRLCGRLEGYNGENIGMVPVFMKCPTRKVQKMHTEVNDWNVITVLSTVLRDWVGDLYLVLNVKKECFLTPLCLYFYHYHPSETLIIPPSPSYSPTSNSDHACHN